MAIPLFTNGLPADVGRFIRGSKRGRRHVREFQASAGKAKEFALFVQLVIADAMRPGAIRKGSNVAFGVLGGNRLIMPTGPLRPVVSVPVTGKSGGNHTSNGDVIAPSRRGSPERGPPD
jgi:hypothetical protein